MEQDIWNSVRGGHGVGHMKESGETLLSWCALNNLAMMNTMYEKNIHKYTWQTSRLQAVALHRLHHHETKTEGMVQ